MLLLFLLLVGCTNKETKQENKEPAVDEEVKEESGEKEKDLINENIANVLKEIRDHYGFITDKIGFYDIEEFETDFIHGQIVDFNDDHSKELVILFKSSNKIDSILENRNANNCSACDVSVGLIQYKEENYGIVISTNQILNGHHDTIQKNIIL